MRERFLAGGLHGMLEHVPRACMHTRILHVHGMCIACMHTGEDHEHYDYERQCDHNPSYDDIEQQGRDEEERWFDDDE